MHVLTNGCHLQRDALTRHVFPDLNARLRSRRVTLMPIDLRWGLTSEDTSDAGLGALDMCLREVEKSRPMCVVLLGERCTSWMGLLRRPCCRPLPLVRQHIT